MCGGKESDGRRRGRNGRSGGVEGGEENEQEGGLEFMRVVDGRWVVGGAKEWRVRER